MRSFCLIAFLAVLFSCSGSAETKKKKGFPSSISFHKQDDSSYVLQVNWPSGPIVYDSVLNIGWDGLSVLIYSVNEGRKCWQYFHSGATIKSWGCYSEKELSLRKKELGLESYPTFKADEAWKEYSAND